MNSTISLEGLLPLLETDPEENKQIIVGCFDWDPFAAQTSPSMLMVKQDVSTMLDSLFEIVQNPDDDIRLIQVPTIVQG
ncbi:hypothetical protein QTO30_00210 [Yoonia sp. GPGPB17]|uniref:hypothetical protein n=1 Tax=Yoonia sp. GPGPB17 TaxID=3026147 RepID=UPI0030BA4E74